MRRIKPKQITSALPYSICRQSQISTIEGSLNNSSAPIFSGRSIGGVGGRSATMELYAAKPCQVVR
ncbi:hypothetical protein TherJR_1347 [Thermincola potens JR]|uniref:Uncharacterized protein n=1 Tax=Thermincola potens (strain JR) TaxID=635013 RepID=D5XEY3_THEPJ|nr:hypothetical protein TherJR_1347 [Thermincola potens JR]